MLNQFIIVSTKKIRSIESGFTLVELMVTIAVLAIIVSIAAPSMSRQLADSRVRNTASVIEESLRTAISESSIQRQAFTYELNMTDSKITNIKLTNPKTSNQSKAYPLNENTTVEVVAIGQVSIGKTSKDYKFTGSDTFKIGPGKRISDMPSGAGDVTRIEFRICDKQGLSEKKQVVSIDMVGQVRQMKLSEGCS